MLHFGKIPKKIGEIWRKFSKMLTKFANFWGKKQQKIQQFLTKFLRLESDAKGSKLKNVTRFRQHSFGFSDDCFKKIAIVGKIC